LIPSLVEFDGNSNHIANYCNYSIVISKLAQHNIQTNQVIESTCSNCTLQPGQLLSFENNGASVGPLVAAYYASTNFNEYSNQQTNQNHASNSNNGIWTKALHWNANNQGATLIFELHNSTPISTGFVVATRSIWAIAQAQIVNACGGIYEQWNSPYDEFSGISKDSSSPTWIPPGGKITVVMKPNTLKGGAVCGLSFATVEAYIFHPGVPNGQPMPIVVTIQ